MDRAFPVSPPRSAPPHHPVPAGRVRLYGLLAVLFVLLPEWMADLRQRSRHGRSQDQAVDRDRLSVTVSRSAQQPSPRGQWPVTVGRAALLVGVGAGLVWDVNQLRPLSQWFPPQAGPSRQAEPLPGAGVPVGQLRLQSSGPSWVEVRGLNGDNLYGAILQGQVLLPLGRGVKVLAGRPDLVRVSVAGERPKVLGRINRIEWVLFPFR